MMKNEEAIALLAEALARYRTLSYEELSTRIGSVEVEEVAGRSGAVYQLEFEFLWNDRRGGNVRVVGGIDGGAISAIIPLTDSFIKTRDGRYIGE